MERENQLQDEESMIGRLRNRTPISDEEDEGNYSFDMVNRNIDSLLNESSEQEGEELNNEICTMIEENGDFYFVRKTLIGYELFKNADFIYQRRFIYSYYINYMEEDWDFCLPLIFFYPNQDYNDDLEKIMDNMKTPNFIIDGALNSFMKFEIENNSELIKHIRLRKLPVLSYEKYKKFLEIKEKYFPSYYFNKSEEEIKKIKEDYENEIKELFRNRNFKLGNKFKDLNINKFII